MKALLRRFAKGSELLDVGCGLGRQWPGFDVLGLDHDRYALALAADRGVKAVEGDACDLPVGSMSQDVVLLLDVLEHVKDDRKALAEAQRVLRDSGILIVSVPLYQALWSRHDDRMGHLRRYRPGRIGEMVCEAGFGVVYRTSWNVLGLIGAVIRKTGTAIEAGAIAARPFLAAESRLVARMPSPIGLSEFVVAVGSDRQREVGQRCVHILKSTGLTRTAAGGMEGGIEP